MKHFDQDRRVFVRIPTCYTMMHLNAFLDVTLVFVPLVLSASVWVMQPRLPCRLSVCMCVCVCVGSLSRS